MALATSLPSSSTRELSCGGNHRPCWLWEHPLWKPRRAPGRRGTPRHTWLASAHPPLPPPGHGTGVARDLSLLLGKRLEQKRVARIPRPPTSLFIPSESPQQRTGTGLTLAGTSPLPWRAAPCSDKKLPYFLLSYKQRIKLGLMNATFPDFWDTDTMRICKDSSFLWPSEYSVWENIYIWICEIKDLGEQRLQQKNNK